MPFKLNQDHRHHIPRQQHKVINWPAYEAGLRQRGLALRVPDHTTLSRRSATLAVPRLRTNNVGDGVQSRHLLVDSTGLKLSGAGEWLVEKHGTRTRRSWRKLHIGVDAGTGQIVAVTMTSKEVDDAVQVGPLLDKVTSPVASVTAAGASVAARAE